MCRKLLGSRRWPRRPPQEEAVMLASSPTTASAQPAPSPRRPRPPPQSQTRPGVGLRDPRGHHAPNCERISASSRSGAPYVLVSGIILEARRSGVGKVLVRCFERQIAPGDETLSPDPREERQSNPRRGIQGGAVDGPENSRPRHHRQRLTCVGVPRQWRADLGWCRSGIRRLEATPVCCRFYGIAVTSKTVDAD